MTIKCIVCQREVPDTADTCPYCGFHINGATQQFAPIKINEGASNVTNTFPLETKDACLLLLNSMQKGSKFPLGSGDIFLGRDPNCTIFLNDMTVSRNHARIYTEKGSHCIEDQGSYNGVWVNNKPVNSTPLKDGDKIQLGNFCFEYQA